MYSQCEFGGWLLENKIDGTQSEYVRIPLADASLYLISQGADEDTLVMFSDVLPTGFETGVLKGKIKLGDILAIVGAGPIGLAALLTAQFYSPPKVIMIDLDDYRLEVAKHLGATATINDKNNTSVQDVLSLTNQKGVDAAIEAVGTLETFDICQSIIGPGSHIANIGAHGKSAGLRLEKLWDRNITLTTALVDTYATPTLLKAFMSGKLDPKQLITHHFELKDVLEAYKTFGDAANQHALKVILKNT